MLSKLILLLVILIAIPLLMITVALFQNNLPWDKPPGFKQRLSTYLSSNDVSTSIDAEYPELEARRYAIPLEQLRKLIETSVDSLGWEILKSFDNTQQLHALVKTNLLKFRDDVYVTIQPDTDYTYLVFVRSVSRTGKGDLGANTRHIMDFYTMLDTVIAGY